MDALLSLLSLDNIWHLDWIVKGPGIVIIGLLLWRAVRSLFSFQPLTLITSLLYALMVTVLLSRFGYVVQDLVSSPTKTREQP